ncbi:MAG: hypothetical protein AB1746_08790 [Candidatus Zixiibacteriota bacterium]
MSNKSDIDDIRIESPPGDFAGLMIPVPDNPESAVRNRMSDIFLRSLSSLFRNNKNIYDIFFSLTKKLNKFFSLSRSILIVNSDKDNQLKVIAMKGPQDSRIGLALTLPRQDSILYQVFNSRAIYTENYPHQFAGNFIERKLLLDDNPGSIAICPVKSDGNVRGLICLTSPALYAFTLFRDGALDAVLERFGRSIEREISRLRV